MKSVSIFLASVLTFVLSSCEYFDYRLLLVNKTRSKIATQVYNDSLPDYPSLNKREFYLRQAFAPGDSARMMQWGKQGWPYYFSRSSNGKLNLVIYDFADLEKYSSIDSMIAHKKYRKLTLDRATVEKNKWRVVIK